ncbi:hypothetical protein [Acaryochloris marina]|uniref:Uncharacterized protein n=1 Tax=Acaryochloris marina (strain MBIC 11017) TaxID=329726 RepID=A8ZM61_ACAM1|nr:hypothetical protein [Acaryochloris marina]ABW31830.1 hypothetical protein AM1_B0104 [Acaryochloris marina MBIC11017]BDM82989.1 hypothetical protein AM10699_58500 [Acaryochloris marina MBIC10699]
MNYKFLICLTISSVGFSFGEIANTLPIQGSILEAEAQILETPTSERGCENHSTTDGLKQNIINKRIYWIISGQSIGWTEYKKDGTYIEDNDDSGNYCVNQLLVTMEIDSEQEITAHLTFPKKYLETRDTINVRVEQYGETILKTKAIISKIENLVEEK